MGAAPANVFRIPAIPKFATIGEERQHRILRAQFFLTRTSIKNLELGVSGEEMLNRQTLVPLKHL
jgi:hypothetical protein